MAQCEARYRIQVGSWTKLPYRKVQEDTRAIMGMMARKAGGFKYVVTSSEYFGRTLVKVLRISDTLDRSGYQRDPSLFIPYEELQKMLNAPKEQCMPSLLNTKLDCRKPDGTVDEELSRAFQEACFEQGFKGRISSKRPFLFVVEGCKYVQWGEDEASFTLHKNKQIDFTYSRRLEWEATVIEPVTPEPVDEMVSICGVEYSAKELKEALELIGKAKK